MSPILLRRAVRSLNLFLLSGPNLGKLDPPVAPVGPETVVKTIVIDRKARTVTEIPAPRD